MTNALRDAKLNITDLDYVNAHGTSTELGDMAETKAMKIALGNTPIKSPSAAPKAWSATLGASGGVEIIACILSIKHGVIHPTINLDNPDPNCDLDYVPKTARERRFVTPSPILSASAGIMRA